MKKEKGITLIALVVTIIVLLILAVITMTFVLGENGLFSRSNNAKEQHKIKGYIETLEILRGASEIEKGVNGISNKVYMDIYEEEANKDKALEEATIKRKSEDTVRVITKEGYIFDVTEKGIEYIGNKEEFPNPPDLKKGDIEFEYVPNDWTNGNVKVGIEIINEEIKNAGYTLEYSIDGIEWHVYTEKIEFEENGAIYARLINKLDMTGGVATGNVANIDKVAPKDFIAEAEVTSNSITVSGSTEDVSKTETNGCSGIARYEYSINNEAWQESNVFNNLTQNTKYILKMKAIDNAGNETETAEIEKTTGEVPKLIEGTNLTFSYNPTSWTNKSVDVTITTSITGYTLQYSTDGTNWNDYTNPVPMAQNGAIHARLRDIIGQIGGYGTGNVGNIDKTNPVVSSATATPTSVTIKATDEASGIIGYTATKTSTEPASFIDCANTKNLDVVVENLEQATTYYVWVKDEAGNISLSKSVETQKQSVTGITLDKTSITMKMQNSETLTATVNPSSAYNKNVTWTSSNPNVATVSNGQITSVADGTATITATAQDGSGKTATCKVTVQTPTLASVAKPGDYVKYKIEKATFTISASESGVDSNQTCSILSASTLMWQVLYNDTSHGIQIIAYRGILGSGKLLLEGKSGYNNSVAILNRISASCVNKSYATSGRCLGSNPNNPEGTKELYRNSLFPNVKDVIKDDTNYITDFNAMKAATNQDKNGIKTIYSTFASRFCNVEDTGLQFGLRHSQGEGEWNFNDSYGSAMYEPTQTGQYDSEYMDLTIDVRPCITLKSGIKTNKGNGTSSSPYELIAQ